MFRSKKHSFYQSYDHNSKYSPRQICNKTLSELKTVRCFIVRNFLTFDFRINILTYR